MKKNNQGIIILTSKEIVEALERRRKSMKTEHTEYTMKNLAGERDRLKAANAEMLEALKSVVQQLNACLDTLNEFQDSETAPEWIKENSATRFICGDPAIVQARAAIKKAEAL